MINLAPEIYFIILNNVHLCCNLKFNVSKDMLHKILFPLLKFIALLIVPENHSWGEPISANITQILKVSNNSHIILYFEDGLMTQCTPSLSIPLYITSWSKPFMRHTHCVWKINYNIVCNAFLYYLLLHILMTYDLKLI